MSILDLVILTIIPEEYQAVCDMMDDLQFVGDDLSSTNLYAWKIGSIKCEATNSFYHLAVGMIGRAGTTKSALAAQDAIDRWRPRYLFYIGIAGGFGQLNKGDVVIADVIYGYEYGKIEKSFNLRHNWTYNTDQALLNGAVAYSLVHEWDTYKLPQPPAQCVPKIVVGEIASGDKIVEDPSNKFFAQVLNVLPKIKAVEMEGVGACEAIEHAHTKGQIIGFMMIRGISDLPRPIEKETASQKQASLNPPIRGTQERDDWKPYASATPANFLIGWLKSGLPVAPILENNLKYPHINSPAIGFAISNWTLSKKKAVIEALLACLSVNDPKIRDDLVNGLPDYIRHNIKRGDSNRADVINILNICLNYADGLQKLVENIEFYENDSIPMQRLKQVLHDSGLL